MSAPTRTDAQQRADDIQVFAEELARLEKEGLLALTDAQREAVASHHRGLLTQFAQAYDIDSDMRAR